MVMAMILFNYKAYPEAIGKGALRLSRYLDEIGEEFGVKISVSPQYLDIPTIIRETVNLEVFSQHVDPVKGAYTGSVSPLSLKEAGVSGSLLNHSERKLEISSIKEGVLTLKDLGLTSIVCAEDELIASMISKLSPDFIAVEPPELIGTGISVSKAKPELLERTLQLKEFKIRILCGAGISSGEDVERAMEIGMDGVLVSSSFVKSKNPKEKALELIEAYSKFI